MVDTAGGSTRRITNTPQHERNVSFRPDGKVVLYASERDGRYDAYETLVDVADAASFQTLTSRIRPSTPSRIPRDHTIAPQPTQPDAKNPAPAP